MSGRDHEFDDEVAAHLEEATADYVSRGMSPREARDAALRDFGGVTQVKQVHREMRSFAFMNWLDFKLGARMLAKYPGLTLIGGVAMAFAICFGLVVFQILSLFIHPTLPLPQGDRLVEMRLMDLEVNDEEPQVLYDFLQWRQSLQTVIGVGAWRDSSQNLIDALGDSRPVAVAEMSASGFTVSDGVPLIGRVLAEADEQPGAPPAAVLGYEVWRTRFGSDPNVVGRAVKFGHDDVTVVGVMREGYEFPIAHDVWMPLKTALLEQAPRSGPALTVFGLLAPGVSITTAQAELTTAGRRAAAQSPSTHHRIEPLVRPFAMLASPAGDPAGQLILYSVYVFAATVLMLICGNVGLLLFARASSRETDLVVRTALGASRARIVGQMFAEALVLGSVAGIAGVVAADFALRYWGIGFLETNIGRLPFWFDVSLSARALAAAIVLTTAASAVAGILPALKITRGMVDRLKQTTAGSGGLQFGGVWTVVIVAQVAATVIFPAVVYVESGIVRNIEDFDPGFASEQYLSVQIERDYPVDAGLTNDAAAIERNQRLAATLEALRRTVSAQPGVAGVTFTEDVPTTNRPFKAIEMGYDLDAPPSGASNAEPALRQVSVAAVAPSYFDVLNAPILAGRNFTSADALPGARAVIVDHGFVDQVLQGRHAVGQQVRFRYLVPGLRSWGPGSPDTSPGPGDWYEIVGVVRELGVGTPTDGRAAGFYIPTTPDVFDQVFMMVHVRGTDPMMLAPRVRDAAAAVDPSLRLVKMQRVNEANNDELWVMTMWLRVTVVLSVVAIVLSLAGIFAVLSFTVARRTREIGVRVALGASRTDVIVAAFRRPMLQVALGIVIGTAMVCAGAIVYRTTGLPGSQNELTIAGMAMIVAYGLGMLGVCMAGCVVPTRRALSIEPTTALRTE